MVIFHSHVSFLEGNYYGYGIIQYIKNVPHKYVTISLLEGNCLSYGVLFMVLYPIN